MARLRTKCLKKWCDGKIIGVESMARYDWISHRLCQKCGTKFSRLAYSVLKDDELCRWGRIFKVEWTSDYEYKIVHDGSTRPDRVVG